MRVLGIDPGSWYLGFGIIEDRSGAIGHVGHGVIRTDPSSSLDLKLKSIFHELSKAIMLYRPAEVAVEGVFSMRNARSALILGHARGVALLVAAQAGLPVFEYAPARVKKAVGAGGRGRKDAVERMVRIFLGLPDFERADASDALAVAICHANHRRSPSQGTPAVSRAGRPASFAERLAPAYRRFGAAR